MSWFRGLDTPAESEAPSVIDMDELTLNDLAAALLFIANAGEGSLETNLGLSESALIALDIIHIAQRAKNHRAVCVDIADQTYQLLNAFDGGVKGRAIDINGILRDHIKRLNTDLLVIRNLLQCFAGWWNLSRLWKASQRLDKCYDILSHAMQMYLLLLRYTLGQSPAGNRRSGHYKNAKKWKTVPPSALGRHPSPGPLTTKLARSNAAASVPPRGAPRMPKSASQPPRSKRVYATDSF